jgi:uncharacterized protein YbaA (DUF1428 family)
MMLLLQVPVEQEEEDNMTLFEQLISNPEYKKIFEQLPNDQKYIIQDGLKNFMDDVENKLINPLKEHVKTIQR